jgi:hypothetical protein
MAFKIGSLIGPINVEVKRLKAEPEKIKYAAVKSKIKIFSCARVLWTLAVTLYTAIGARSHECSIYSFCLNSPEMVSVSFFVWFTLLAMFTVVQR